LLLLPIPVDNNDDDLARLEARFDPEYASFKTQLDALLRKRIPRQFQHLSFRCFDLKKKYTILFLNTV
jgi:hypothetical protein